MSATPPRKPFASSATRCNDGSKINPVSGNKLDILHQKHYIQEEMAHTCLNSCILGIIRGVE